MISIPIIATVILGIFILMTFAAAVLNLAEEGKSGTTNTLFVLCIVFGLFIAGYWVLYYCR